MKPGETVFFPAKGPTACPSFHVVMVVALVALPAVVGLLAVVRIAAKPAGRTQRRVSAAMVQGGESIDPGSDRASGVIWCVAGGLARHARRPSCPLCQSLHFLRR